MKTALSLLIILFLCTFLSSEEDKLETLLKDLNSSDGYTNLLAIEHLGILKDKRAIKPLEEAFIKNQFISKDRDDKCEVVDALRMINHPDAIDSLLRILKTADCTDKIIAALTYIDPDWRQREKAQNLFDDCLLSIQEKDAKFQKTIKIVPIINPEKSLQPLIKLLQDRSLNEYNLNLVCKSLGMINSKEALNPLIEYLFNAPMNSFYQDKIIEALDKIDPDWRSSKIVKDKIFNMLKKTEWPNSDSNKFRMIYYFGLFKEKRAVPFLIEMADETEPQLRYEAISALASIDYENAQSVIKRALHDKKEWIRAASVSSLGDAGIKKYCPLLIDLLQSDENRISNAAIGSIRKLKCSSALPALINIIEKNYKKYSAEYYIEREDVLYAIISIGDNSVVPTLLKWLKQKKYFRENLIYTLAQFNDKSIAESVIPLLEDSTIALDTNAIEILRKSDDPRALKLLQEALMYTDWEIRAHAEWAIWSMQNRKAITQKKAN